MAEMSCGEDSELAVFRDSKIGEGCISAFWQRFLRRIRILLVESDNSTRTIIAALLRKCSYRVVAVSDGLEAWEVLKSRSHNIDLILTEVHLPSISGFALLTLITEHERCKRIPVVMMSTHDSMSVVYKCMRKGAADFLVKPVRRNELRNLWRHVWRIKQPLNSGRRTPQGDDNKAPSNRSSNAQSYSTKLGRHDQVHECNLEVREKKQGNDNKRNILRHSHESAFSRWV